MADAVFYQCEQFNQPTEGQVKVKLNQNNQEVKSQYRTLQEKTKRATNGIN